MTENNIIEKIQKDLKDIKSQLKLLFQVVEMLERIKMTNMNITKEGRDIKEKDILIKKCREVEKFL